MLMVTMESATTLSWSHYNQVPIEGDHSTIAKFSHASQSCYKTVVGRLKEAIKTITGVVGTLPSCVKSMSPLCQVVAHINLGELVETRRTLRDWLAATKHEAEYEKNLHHKAAGTCSWVFQTSEYRNWRESAQGKGANLWIKGKPGAYSTSCEYRINW